MNKTTVLVTPYELELSEGWRIASTLLQCQYNIPQENAGLGLKHIIQFVAQHPGEMLMNFSKMTAFYGGSFFVVFCIATNERLVHELLEHLQALDRE